jgi:hypothetical protein
MECPHNLFCFLTAEEHRILVLKLHIIPAESYF